MATATKADIRKEFLEKRNALDPGVRARHSSLIRQRVFQHPAWKNVHPRFCATSPSVRKWKLTCSFKKRCASKSAWSCCCMIRYSKETHLSELQRFGELGNVHRGRAAGAAGISATLSIPRKSNWRSFPASPLTGKGGRIGFGGGYFDRLLPKMPKAFRLGLAFSAQVLTDEPLPLESHDVRMHAIITENEIIDTKAKANP